ncbi:DUF6950 family protein [Magnetococcus sp. PR-3]|uniref:DUF6950 family protein n=1 Tax=Magnetococcus sp. PR-3 TaxID=3120355 RepID=UPI002FCE3B71
MQRFKDWPNRLEAYLHARNNTPFEWGFHDCVVFACGAVEVLTGVQITLPIYADAKEAVVAIKAHGGLMMAVNKALPDRQVPPFNAQRGDIVLYMQGPWPTLGVCAGRVVFTPSEEGLRGVPLERAICAWRV